MFRRIKSTLFGIAVGFAVAFSAYAQSISPISGLVPDSAPYLTGPLIRTLNTDRATYTSGDVVTVFVGLSNTTGSSYTGTVSATVYGRGHLMSSASSVEVTSLASGSTQVISLQLPTTGMADYQGYLVEVTATNASGDRVDSQNTAIDFSPDWWTYPRQCWVTGTFVDWGGWNPSSIYNTPYKDISALNAMHCNNLQLYNNLFRWHIPLGPSELYVNGDGQTQSKPLIRQSVSMAKSLRMGTMFYIPAYAAAITSGKDFTRDGSGTDLKWAMFDSNCSTNQGGCTISNVWKFNQDIGYMNPNNVEWQYHWAQQAKLVLDAFGVDGFFIDTYGTINTPLWDFSGNRIIMDTAYSSMLHTVAGLTPAAYTLNPAGVYNEKDLVMSKEEIFHFAERWNNPTDIGTFQDFFTRAYQIWGWGYDSGRKRSIGLDWDMGMDKTLSASKDCTLNGGQTSCVFNLPGVLYQEAAMLASGAHHDWIVGGSQGVGQGVRFISNDDYPIGNMLGASSSMIQAEFDYQTFGVAYEKLLRLNVSKSSLSDPSVTSSGVSASTTATAGKVWMSQTSRSGFDVLHLINLSTMSSASLNDVNDNAANAAEASLLSSVDVKMYYTGSGDNLGNLYIASPDANHGNSTTLTYTKGSDGSGNYITFTVPSLKYWDLVWLENGVSTSDYTNP